MEFASNVDHHIACYMGRERSPRIVTALNDLNIKAQCVEGGMKRLSQLCPEEVRKIIPPEQSLVTLIWSGGDSEYVRKIDEAARNVLLLAGINNRIHRVDDFLCYFLGKKVRVDEIFC